ncbi:Golgi-specific brefeldin A-resistance guanine nucleotide exchange factor 1-like [Orbicella faveolata]|uniref:Golgi-specific brefeldin A-resistance guanine nucleotide exchange factor 1-like n=1 Tax=Orbicella faveolata TaxID=48498 RepID=UPI0009E46A9C|nr:Golgi-specific brefeldin A-resistance guanine nucleotide exchange factor 1-like [Orbicella faveolata]
MIHMGLSLLTVALESGSHHIGTFPSLMNFVKDDLCKNLFWLVQCDFLGLFTMALRVCFLLFEGLRAHLKFQMEMFFKKLMDILALDLQSVHYEKRELILDAINQVVEICSQQLLCAEQHWKGFLHCHTSSVSVFASVYQ